MKKTTIVITIFLLIVCSCFTTSYAQEDDPAAQIAVEDQSADHKDVSEYTDAELVELYLNDPNSLPEMSEEQLSHLTDLAVEQQNPQSE